MEIAGRDRPEQDGSPGSGPRWRPRSAPRSPSARRAAFATDRARRRDLRDEESRRWSQCGRNGSRVGRSGRSRPRRSGKPAHGPGCGWRIREGLRDGEATASARIVDSKPPQTWHGDFGRVALTAPDPRRDAKGMTRSTRPGTDGELSSKVKREPETAPAQSRCANLLGTAGASAAGKGHAWRHQPNLEDASRHPGAAALHRGRSSGPIFRRASGLLPGRVPVLAGDFIPRCTARAF